MLTFGVIAEGPTDQTVIENIILGFFDNLTEEPMVNPIQPPRPLADTPAGWGHVFASLQRHDYDGALQFNDFLVIHIDADVQEEPGFDVPRRARGRELSVSERVDHISRRLMKDIDTAFYQGNAHRVLFAIAVDSMECWLLPLLLQNSQAAKTTGCLEAANRALRRKNEDALSTRNSKFMTAYEQASSGYRRRRTLIEVGAKNPSLKVFVGRLENLLRDISASER